MKWLKVLTGAMMLCLLTSFTHAQVFFTDNDLFTAKARFAVCTGNGTTSATVTSGGIKYVQADSSADIDLWYTEKYTDGTSKSFYPDSILLIWYGKGVTNADSIGLIFQLAAKVGKLGTSYLTRTTIDSIKAQENDFKVLTRTWYEPFDKVRFIASLNRIVSGGPNKTQLIGSGGAVLYCTARMYYHK